MSDVGKFVQFVQFLADVAGGRSEGCDLAIRFARDGMGVLRGGAETVEFLNRRAQGLDLIDAAGAPRPRGASKLVRVAEIIRHVPVSTSEARHPSLVYTVPEDASSLVPRGQRLSYLVEDLIRMSVRTLRIGSPFWNQDGFDQLLPVLVPAVRDRRVNCAFYLHGWKQDAGRKLFVDMLERLGYPDRVRAWLYQGPGNSLLHAKFVVADGERGLLGTANLTSLGLRHHVEVGVPLAASQCLDLERFLDGLVERGLLIEITKPIEQI